RSFTDSRDPLPSLLPHLGHDRALLVRQAGLFLRLGGKTNPQSTVSRSASLRGSPTRSRSHRSSSRSATRGGTSERTTSARADRRSGSGPDLHYRATTIITINLMMLIAMPTMTIPVKRETWARLRSYKVGGATYDDVLNDLMDDRPSAGFVRDHLRRLKEEEFSDWEDVRKRLRL